MLRILNILHWTIKFPLGSVQIIYFTSAVLIVIIMVKRKRARRVELIEKLPGPPTLPFLGNTVEINVEHDGKSCKKS